MADYTYLVHHGIKGQRWGIRRFRNEDGSLTPAGKKRYSETEALTYEGGKRTRKLTSKLLKDDKWLGGNRTAAQQAKIDKQVAKITKSFNRDIAKAESVGNDAAVKRLNAGKTYLNLISNPQYFQMHLAVAARRAEVSIGEDFSYRVLRDENLGGVMFEVNGVKTYYQYPR